MRSLSAPSLVPAAKNGVQVRNAGSKSGPRKRSRFYDAAKGLWPHNTAAEVASRTGRGVGTVKHWFRGTEPSPLAIAVIVDEITSEFR